MQTFLPYPSFDASAEVLDRKRLGKQRVEVLQIMAALTELRFSREDREMIETFKPAGWLNHPAVRMWRGHEASLRVYQHAVCDSWDALGFHDTCRAKTDAIFTSWLSLGGTTSPMAPDWLGDPDLHLSHRSNLLRKDPEHYGPIFGDIPNDLEYVWPVS